MLQALPEDIDKSVLPAALNVRSKPDSFAEFVTSDFVWRSIDAAGHYIIALEQVLEKALAPWVLGRASLEASASAAWMCDIGVSSGERLKRNLALQLDDLPNNGVGTGKVVQETLFEIAEKNGLAISSDTFQRTIPRKSKIVEDALGMRLWYEEFSAIVHNNSFSHIAVALDVPDSDDPRINTLIPVVIWAYGVAVWRFFKTRELPSDGLEASLNKAAAVLSFPEGFWEQRPQPHA